MSQVIAHEAADYVLVHGDFAETLSLVEDVGGADLICTSPPYCDARTYGADVSWIFEDYQRLGDSVSKALKPGGHCLLNIDAPVREWRKGFGTERGFMPWLVMLDWAQRVGLRVPERMAYGRNGIPGAYGGRFRNDWEPLLWFQRLGKEGYFDKFSIAEIAKYNNPGSATGRRNSGFLERRPGNITNTGRAAEEGLRHRGTYWKYGAIGSSHDPIGTATNHPARFFSGLAEDIVRCFSSLGGLVCDPFVGSGTTAAAAIKYGRVFIGGDMLCRVEDDVPWTMITKDRIETLKNKRTCVK